MDKTGDKEQEPKLTNICPECGMNLVIRSPYSNLICYRNPCKGIILSNETLREFQSFDKKQKDGIRK